LGFEFEFERRVLLWKKQLLVVEWLKEEVEEEKESLGLVREEEERVERFDAAIVL